MDPIGAVLSWVAARGVLGLLVVTLCERLVPVLPSYAVLVAIGIAAAHGQWSLGTAIVASTVGGLTGAVLFYVVGAALARRRSRATQQETRLARATSRVLRLFGASPDSIDRLTIRFRAHERACAFCSQLMPGVRLVAPGVAGFLRLDAPAFVTWTALGIVLWNMLFIAVGHVAARTVAGVQPSTLALQTVMVLIAGECILVIVWRVSSLRRRAGDSARPNARIADGSYGD
jgi:membrane protein DedA with SNARE-associated domain